MLQSSETDVQPSRSIVVFFFSCLALVIVLNQDENTGWKKCPPPVEFGDQDMIALNETHFWGCRLVGK